MYYTKTRIYEKEINMMPNKELNLLVTNGNYGIVVIRKKEHNLAMCRLLL